MHPHVCCGEFWLAGSNRVEASDGLYPRNLGMEGRGRVVPLELFRSTLPFRAAIRCCVAHDVRLGVGGENARESARHGGEVETWKLLNLREKSGFTKKRVGVVNGIDAGCLEH